MSILRAVKGMNDLFYPEILLWQKIEKLTAEIFSVYGFQEIRTPILEDLGLFVRSVGETSDIVEKEMYVLKDRDEKMLALRPENTAGVVRALIESNQLNSDAEVKCFYMGSMFRRERPQKGRLRQFYQIGAEVFGVKEPSVDVEVIAMVHDLLSTLKIANLKLVMNTLGEPFERDGFVKALHGYFSIRFEALCSDCQRRLEKNTLRILDCKKPGCVAEVEKAPKISGYLSSDSLTHFEAVQNGLTRLSIPFEVSPNMVRGLDYYTRTVFEIIATDGLGSQNAVAGGGRYDGLVKNLGGGDVPAFGFAAGIERIILLLEEQEKKSKHYPLDIMLVYADESGQQKAHELLYELRRNRIKTDIDYKNRSLKSQMRRADRLNSKAVIVLGDKEAEEQKAVLKCLENGHTVLVDLDANHIKNALEDL